MKKIIGLIIGGILLIIIGSCYFKYVYVPKGMTYRIKYENLKKEVKGYTQEIMGEFTGSGFHTRVNFQRVDDSITYTFDIINDGDIPAKLFHEPYIIGKDNITKKYISRYLLYKDGSDIKKGDELKPGERVTIEYRIVYSEAELQTNADGNHFEVTLLFPYLQNR